MCIARRERNLQGLVKEPLSFPFLYVLGDKENPPNWKTPFNLDYDARSNSYFAHFLSR